MENKESVPEKIQGYKVPVELKYNTLLLNIFSLIVFVLSLFGFNFLRILIEKGKLDGSFSGSFDAFSLLILFLVFIITVLVHELIHGIFFKIFKYKVSFGVVFPIALYTIAKKQFVNKKDYLIVALAPFFVINLIGIFLLFFKVSSLSNVAVWALIINTSGAVGDLWISYIIAKSPKKTLFYDSSPFKNYIYYLE